MPIKKKPEKDVQVLLLQNHGFFVAADTVEEIGVLFDSVIEKLEKQVKRTADVSNAVTPEKKSRQQRNFPGCLVIGWKLYRLRRLIIL